MPGSSEDPDATAPAALTPSRAVELAAGGLVARLVTPGRVHAANGHLHNAVMLTDLLARQIADAAGGEGPLHRRVVSIAGELAELDLELKRLHALLSTPPSERHERCHAELALGDAHEVLRAEAARLSAGLTVDLPGSTVEVRGARASIARACIVCGVALLEQAARGGSVLIVARAADHELDVEFRLEAQGAPPVRGELAADETVTVALLVAIAAGAGAELDAGPALRLRWRRTDAPRSADG